MINSFYKLSSDLSNSPFASVVKTGLKGAVLKKEELYQLLVQRLIYQLVQKARLQTEKVLQAVRALKQGHKSLFKAQQQKAAEDFIDAQINSIMQLISNACSI